MFHDIQTLIERYPRIILHRHKNPDGDALGAQIGLYHILKSTYPEKEIFTVGDMTPRYAFMVTHPMDEIPDSAYEGALAVILDTAARPLISDERYTLASATARLDHHLFCEKIADSEVIDTTFESCCGLVAEMAIECGFTVSDDAARALYTGMVTDSGRFRYDSTTAKTFRIAAFLAERNLDTAEIFRNLYADELDRIQLRAQFTMKIQKLPNNVAYIYTTREELESYPVDTFTVSRGMVNVMSDIKGIDIWANFTETENGILCEMRSSLYNINPIAVKYGGGGHAKACGATLHTREEAMALLSDLQTIPEEAV